MKGSPARVIRDGDAVFGADPSRALDLVGCVVSARMMRAFESMAGDLDNIDENDPKQAARMMRRLFDASGMKLGNGMVETIRRMESGEDPGQIGAEMRNCWNRRTPSGGPR